MTIIFDKYEDRDSILAAIALGSYKVKMQNAFITGAPEDIIVDVVDFDSTYREAFLKTVDQLLFTTCENATVWKVARDAKTFNLENSYVRSALVSGVATGVLTTGVPLRVKFEVPGFLTSLQREIDLWYNDDFNPVDVAALDEIGVTLTGNGSEFTIANLVETKVSFSKPVGVSGLYVINYDNEIVAP